MADLETGVNGDLADLSDFVSIITTYGCKLCRYSTISREAFRDHVDESHSNEKAVVSANNKVCKNTDRGAELNVSVTPVESTNEDNTIDSADAEPEKKIVKLNFVCSLCDTSFSSTDIVGHLVCTHGLQLESLLAGEEAAKKNDNEEGTNPLLSALSLVKVGMPSNVTSVGTQVVWEKKPRKRRNFAALMAAKRKRIKEDQNEDDELSDKNDPKQSYEEEIEGIIQVSSHLFELPKRQIRPPKTLVDDYHIIHHRQWKRREASSGTGERFECGVEGCTASFSSSESLEYHVKCHKMNGDTMFSCPECEDAFATWTDLRSHLLESHEFVIDRFHCELCDYGADSAESLTEHNMAVHSLDTFAEDTEKPKTALKRGRKRKSAIDDDSAVDDTGEPESTTGDSKPEKEMRFKCKVCGHGTAYKSMMLLHMKKHSGEKSFLCDQCSFMTSDAAMLQRHKEKHGDRTKPYRCSFCAFSYNRESSLQQHIEAKHADALPGANVDDGSSSDRPVGKKPKTAREAREMKAKRRAKNEKASQPKIGTVVYSCTQCRYQTVNRRSFVQHMASHGILDPFAVDGSCVPVAEAGPGPARQSGSVLSSLVDAAASLQSCSAVSLGAGVEPVAQPYTVLSS